MHLCVDSYVVGRQHSLLANLMKKRYTKDQIMKLAKISNRDDRDKEKLRPKHIREIYRGILQDMYSKLDYLNDLALLEAVLIRDEYYDSKDSFASMGLRYGFIQLSVRQNNGTNYYRYYKKNSRSSKDRLWLKPNKRLGQTTEKTFTKYSVHKDEVHNCKITEDEFIRLRKQDRLTRETMRRIRELKIMEGVKFEAETNSTTAGEENE